LEEYMASEKTKPEAPRRSLDGLLVVGVIPDGHKGPYEPPLHEYVAAIESATEIRIAQVRAAQSEAITLLRNQTGKTGKKGSS
jgi:hypothetical protein